MSETYMDVVRSLPLCRCLVLYLQVSHRFFVAAQLRRRDRLWTGRLYTGAERHTEGTCLFLRLSQAINAFRDNADPHVSHLTLTSRGGLPFRNFLGALFDLLTDDGCPLPLPLPPTVEGTVRKKPPPAHCKPAFIPQSYPAIWECLCLCVGCCLDISGFIAEYLLKLKDLLPPLLVPSSGSEAPSSGKHTHSTRTPVHSTPQVTKLTGMCKGAKTLVSLSLSVCLSLISHRSHQISRRRRCRPLHGRNSCSTLARSSWTSQKWRTATPTGCTIWSNSS